MSSEKNIDVLILGGDGYLGWPTALQCADDGYSVVIGDNSRRRITDEQLGLQSLTPIRSISERLDTWDKLTGGDKHIDHVGVDMTDYETLRDVIGRRRPTTILDFAEQRSAPFSMRDPAAMRDTVANNVTGTHNLLNALIETGVEAHVVHLGTMGIYGYGVEYGTTEDGPIPEGYKLVSYSTPRGVVSREILHPTAPGSIYEMTKLLDADMFRVYADLFGVRVTDLYQGIVWETQTQQTRRDERLINRFDYDADYGTVLNRFIAEAAIDHPLTIHGSGGQTKAFISLGDTVRGIQLAIKNPPTIGEKPRIYHQVTETHKVRNLAHMVVSISGVAIEYLPDPRMEVPEYDFDIERTKLIGLGLDPTQLTAERAKEDLDIAIKYADRIDTPKLPTYTFWRPGK